MKNLGFISEQEIDELLSGDAVNGGSDFITIAGLTLAIIGAAYATTHAAACPTSACTSKC